MIILIFITSMASPAFACGEGYTSSSVHFSGTVKSGETFQKDITQNYYFASGFFGQNVKVFTKPSTSIYFWLVPDAHGWQIKIGPTKDAVPDYIAITAWPNKPTPPLYIENTAPPRELTFCFNNEPQAYISALADIKKTGKSGMVDIFNRSCEAKGDDNVMGLGSFVIKGISTEILEFTAYLKIPIYTTDCPPP